MTELVAGIGHGDRLGSLREDIAGKKRSERVVAMRIEIQSKFCRQPTIKPDQVRLGDRHGIKP